MKIPLPKNNSVRIIAPLLFLGLTLVLFSKSYGRSSKGIKRLTGETRDSIFVHKNITSKSHRIGLYPDADNKVLFFTVRGVQGRVYQLYLFDTSGKLVKQTEIRNKQTTLINNMDKGVYLFEVFSDDERVGNGQIAVK
jgi:hypothetical protein